MRLGLIGDIHGDARALERTLRHLETLAVQQVLCTGDVIGYGSQADQVVDMIRDLAIPCVRGNHDRWALEKRRVIGLQGWKPARFKDDTWQFLEALPVTYAFCAGARSVVVHHGSPASDMEFVTPYKPLPESVEHFWNHSDADVLLLGHTHIPMIDRTLRGTILNPGSLHGVPGVQTSFSFSILDLEDLSIRIYDVRLAREIRRDPIFLPEDVP
jgi:putative phosphoesterase